MGKSTKTLRKFNRESFRFFKTSETKSKSKSNSLAEKIRSQGFKVRRVFNKPTGRYLLYVKRGRKRRIK